MAQPKKMRLNGVMFLSVVIIGILIIRLAFLQVIQGDHHQTLAQSNYERNRILHAPRGMMLDTNGKIIARNEYRYEVGILTNPRSNWIEAFEFLADFFQWEDEEREDGTLSLKERKLRQARGNRRYFEPVVLQSNVTFEQMLRLEEMKFLYPMIDITPRPVRHYEESTFFAHLLGVNWDGSPRISTVEQQWNEFLTGQNGYIRYMVDVRGVPIETLGQEQAIPGNNLILTIDSDLQKHTEKALAEWIHINQQAQIRLGNTPGRHGAAVVLDVRNGDVLSMVSYPTIDTKLMNSHLIVEHFNEIDRQLNAHLRPNQRQPQSNYHVFWPLWPRGVGSTIKILTSIMALEEGVITPNQRYNDTGSYIGRDRGVRPVTNFDNRVWGSVNLKEAFAVSLNTYFAYMIDSLAPTSRERVDIILQYK